MLDCFAEEGCCHWWQHVVYNLRCTVLHFRTSTVFFTNSWLVPQESSRSNSLQNGCVGHSTVALLQWSGLVDNLKVLENFVKVALQGSLSQVATEVGRTPSALSKQMTELEREVGTVLLERGRNQTVSLTPRGKFFLDGVAPLLVRLRELQREAAGFEEPEGVLRVKAPRVLAQYLLASAHSAFSARYPKVQLHLVQSTLDEDVTIFISPTQWRVSDEGRDSPDKHVLHLLGEQVWVAVSGADSAQRALHHPRELRKVFALNVDVPLGEWSFTNGDNLLKLQLKPEMVSDDPDDVLAYARRASGVALLPLWAVQGALKSAQYFRVLPEWSVEPSAGRGHIFASVPALRAKLPSVKAFLDHVIRHLGKADAIRPRRV